ncbi:MAG TPA: hypothetical protein VLI40_06955 [Gemmatimonadaceae bacterium]|nr:hypothetical protein [Gemmatimonadaceae bacterium]
MYTKLVAPDLSLLRPFAFRMVPLWLIIHMGLAWASRGETILLSPLATGGMMIIGATVGILDGRRRHELLFLRNLGVDPVFVGLVCAMTIGAAELLATASIVPLRGMF